MTQRLTAYQLSESQVVTPEPIVSLFWSLVKKHRSSLRSVLDLGAGDCRFAKGGRFKRYVGVEIDKNRVAGAQPPPNGRILHCCAFEHGDADYDACIGNPPYARHHDIETAWKDKAAAKIQRELTVSLNKHCNLYIYFLCLALLRSRTDGLVALVIPYEWVSRPSVDALRQHIRKQRWSVAVYRFQMPIFDGVLTTASISIIDKKRRDGRWKYYDITPEHQTRLRAGPTDSKEGVLEYEDAGEIWALRGLSPGSQKVFTLTEGERIHAGLGKRDVVPCVTTLKNVPLHLRLLTQVTFQKHFVDEGRRCWLIRSCEKKRSEALDAYLQGVAEPDRDTYTCQNQAPWFNYRPHPVPQILFSSGFTHFGPKVLINSVGAHAVGSAWGIHAEKKLPLRRLQEYLLGIDFEQRIVPHAKTLKKVEVRQLNAVLNAFSKDG